MAVVAVMALGLVSLSSAQRYYGLNHVAEEQNVRYDGRFTFVRL